jgi:hypothetical protein
VVRRRDADEPELEAATVTHGFFVTSPNAVGLPAAERGDAPAPLTSSLVAERWPQIERLLADGRAASAISSMEALAVDMRRATAGDAPLFRDALTLARQILYRDLAQVGQATNSQELARAALSRCAAWDGELRPCLEELTSS